MIIMAVGDPHCNAMHESYPDFLSDMRRAYKPDKIVIMGDVADNHCIHYHEKSPNAVSPRDEIAEARRQIKLLQKVTKGRETHVLTGNHDALPQRKAVSYGIPQEMIKRPEELWETKDWIWHPRFKRLEIEGVIYSHGDQGKRGGSAIAANPALENAVLWFRSVVQGHFHSLFCAGSVANEDAIVFGLQVGCGMDIHTYNAEYGKQFTKKPIRGCGFVIDGEHPILEKM